MPQLAAMSAMKIDGSEQTGELLDDLLASLGKDDTPFEEIPPYFLGCIVLIKQEYAPDAQVVDGATSVGDQWRSHEIRCLLR